MPTISPTDYNSKEFRTLLDKLGVLNDGVSRHLYEKYSVLSNLSKIFKEYYGSYLDLDEEEYDDETLP